MYKLKDKNESFGYMYTRYHKPGKAKLVKKASSFDNPWDKKIFYPLMNVPDKKVSKFLVDGFLSALG